MKPSLFDPQTHVMHDASRESPAAEEIPTGERSREEILAELAFITRTSVASIHLQQMKLAAVTYPEEFRRILMDACSELGLVIEQHKNAVGLLDELHGRLYQREQALADRLADLERRAAVIERHLEEPPDFQRQEEQGQLNVRRGYKFPSRRTF